MGALFSTLRLVLQTFRSLINDYDVVSKRLSRSPGIPRLNSSVPYWTFPPSPIAHRGRDAELPRRADIVIIGSGITGTSVAKALLEQIGTESDHIEPLNIVMLEAREACSGATGRNGGHASPMTYSEYFGLKKAHGAALALQILQFRLAHISTLLAVAKEEGLLDESQARTVENYDAFLRPEFFAKTRDELHAFMKEVPKVIADEFKVTDEREAIEKLQLATSIIGLISKPGASIHPYRLITGILLKLLSRFSNFQLHTHTACTEITAEQGKYIITTPKGKIQAQHVIHATNAWASHLVPGLRRKIVPLKAHMSTQRPGKGLHVTDSVDSIKAPGSSDWTGQRAFVFYPGNLDITFDYLTQLLPAPSPKTAPIDDNNKSLPPHAGLPTAGEFMFGGGAMIGGSNEAAMLDVIGVADDEHPDFAVEAYLSGALPLYFSKNWGEEGTSSGDEANSPPSGEWGKGRVKAMWTGLVGLSADANPWVGRVPPSVSGRPELTPMLQASSPPESRELNSKIDTFTLAPPGEWICAGYSGEGMVHAWLSGRALVRMILGVSGGKEVGGDPELPAPFLITEKRIKQARIEDFMENI